MTESLSTRIDRSKLAQLINTSLSRLKPETLRSYSYGLSHFAEYCSADDPADAIARLISMSRGEANYFVLEYIGHLKQEGMSSSTISSRLAAIKGRVADARMVGMVDYNIDIKAPKVEATKDVSGPTESQFLRILRYVDAPQSAIEHRTRAIVYMLAFMALRRNEIVSIDVEDIDFHRRKVMIGRKGRSKKEPISIPPKTFDAICEWMRVSSVSTGPLFVNFDPAKKGDSRYSATSLYRMVRRIGDDCSIAGLHPHAFRHFSITEALEVTDGNTRKTQKHSGHSDPRMIDVYADNREDDQLQVSSAIEGKWIK